MALRPLGSGARAPHNFSGNSKLGPYLNYSVEMEKKVICSWSSILFHFSFFPSVAEDPKPEREVAGGQTIVLRSGWNSFGRWLGRIFFREILGPKKLGGRKALLIAPLKWPSLKKLVFRKTNFLVWPLNSCHTEHRCASWMSIVFQGTRKVTILKYEVATLAKLECSKHHLHLQRLKWATSIWKLITSNAWGVTAHDLIWMLRWTRLLQ